MCALREAFGKRDILVADIEDLEMLDESEMHAKEVLMPQDGGTFIFLVEDGEVKLAGTDLVLRESTLIQDHLARGEEHNDVV